MRLRRSSRIMIFVLAAVFVLTLMVPLASYAASTGKRNVAIGLGALGAYWLIKGKTGAGLVAGAGAYYMYRQYQKEREEEKRQAYWDQYYRNRAHSKSPYRSR